MSNIYPSPVALAEPLITARVAAVLPPVLALLYPWSVCHALSAPGTMVDNATVS